MRNRAALVLALGAIWAAAGWPHQAPAAEPELRLERDAAGRPVACVATGLAPERLRALAALPAEDDAWARLLSVFVGGPDAPEGLPPLAGDFAVNDGQLRFAPRFPFRAGVAYRAVLRLEAGPPVLHEWTTPAPATRPPRVTAVYPSAPTLPENQLRFYLHFSQPMARGEAYEHLALLTENGEEVDLPFLEIGEELWDARGERLTLLIDPGRIKKGVKPREDLGPALSAGRKYTLVIRAGWRDEAGERLAARHEKRFTAGRPVEEAIDPAAWRLDPPAEPGSPVSLRFPRPLDHALLQRAIRVETAAGQLVAGETTVGAEERSWSFVPAEPWQPGPYWLVIDTTLEDLAGNRIGRAFEVDRFDPIERKATAEFIRLPFAAPRASVGAGR